MSAQQIYLTHIDKLNYVQMKKILIDDFLWCGEAVRGLTIADCRLILSYPEISKKTHRICNSCGISKEIKKFCFKNGKILRHCKDCRNNKKFMIVEFSERENNSYETIIHKIREKASNKNNCVFHISENFSNEEIKIAIQSHLMGKFQKYLDVTKITITEKDSIKTIAFPEVVDDILAFKETVIRMLS